jgi:YggT family protein
VHANFHAPPRFSTRHHPLAPLARAVYTMRPAIGGGGCSMIPLLLFVDYLINLYEYVIIASVIFSWLIAFNVINAHNPFVRTVWQALGAVTEPLLRRIRRFMPDLGGLDISPVVLLLACFFVRFVVIRGWLIEGALRG